jgi:hypothetical protein
MEKMSYALKGQDGQVLRRVPTMIRNWRLLNKPKAAAQLEAWAQELETRSGLPPRLTWERNVNLRSTSLVRDESGDVSEHICPVVDLVNQDIVRMRVCLERRLVLRT